MSLRFSQLTAVRIAISPFLVTGIRNENHAAPVETELRQVIHDALHVLVPFVVDPGECVFFAEGDGAAAVVTLGGVEDARFVGVAFVAGDVRVEGEGGSIGYF